MSLVGQIQMLDQIIGRKKKEMAEIAKRKRLEIKPIDAKRTALKNRLIAFMTERNLEEYQGITLASLKPKPKKQKISRDVQEGKLRKMGIRNPDAALKEIGV